MLSLCIYITVLPKYLRVKYSLTNFSSTGLFFFLRPPPAFPPSSVLLLKKISWLRSLAVFPPPFHFYCPTPVSSWHLKAWGLLQTHADQARFFFSFFILLLLLKTSCYMETDGYYNFINLFKSTELKWNACLKYLLYLVRSASILFLNLPEDFHDWCMFSVWTCCLACLCRHWHEIVDPSVISNRITLIMFADPRRKLHEPISQTSWVCDTIYTVALVKFLNLIGWLTARQATGVYLMCWFQHVVFIVTNEVITRHKWRQKKINLNRHCQFERNPMQLDFGMCPKMLFCSPHL